MSNGIGAGTAKEETFTFNSVSGISNFSGDLIFRTIGSDIEIKITSDKDSAIYKIPYADRNSLETIKKIIGEMVSHIDKNYSNTQRKIS